MVRELTKIYGDIKLDNAVVALKDVQFSVQEGEFIAIMGPSGSGKTTLLNIISGIDTPTTGDVLLNEKYTEIGVGVQERYYTQVLIEPKEEQVQ